jgi:N-formylmaleamate deformylase
MRLFRVLVIAAFASTALAQPTQPASQPPKGAPPASAKPVAESPLTPLAHVEVRGKGPIPMVLIPGLGCDWTVFDAFMTRNADRYTMYAVTLPGIGKTAAPALPDKTPVSDDRWLRNAERAVVQLVEERKLDRPVVVGHSLGGHLAFRLAAEHGDKFRAAVSLDGLPAFPMSDKPMTKEERVKMISEGTAPLMSGMTDEQWGMQTRMMVGMWVENKDRAKAIGDMCAATPARNGVRYMLELMCADVTDELPKITIPFLAISAVPPEERQGQSKDTVRQVWKDLLKGQPKITLVYFENTHHFIMEDAPAELDKAVEDFLAGRKVEGKSGGEAKAPKPADPAKK